MKSISFGLSRVNLLVDPVTGIAQVSDFPEEPPKGKSDLAVRIKHFTEIENFGFLGFVLAHELGGPKQHIKTLQGLKVADDEVQALIEDLKRRELTDEELGDEILDADINWEHFVASTNDLLIPGDPLKISDQVLQDTIDSLDELSEALVREVNRRARERAEKQRKQRSDI